jgi:Flp pilus assembly pilin Flp
MRRALKPHSLLRRRSLWCDEGGISSVEYALLLSYLAGSIALAANFLGGAVSNEITKTASVLPCGNNGGGNGTGGGGGPGQGGGNTC